MTLDERRAKRAAALQAHRQKLAARQAQQAAPSQADITAFYESWEWKRLRYAFLKHKRRRCQCCGRTPDQDGVRIVVDHIRPVRRFWNQRLDATNLQLLCDDCNQGKGSRDTTDWRSDEARQ